MLEYNNLSPVEFEYLCQDIMQRKLGISLRRFSAGKDQGIDLVDDVSNIQVLLQAKHYYNTSFSTLKRDLKAELKKVEKINPKEYYLCCTSRLTPGNIKEIYALFSDYMQSDKNIITIYEIDAFLTNVENIDILRKHFKLWLSSTNILSAVYNQNIFIDTESLMFDIEKDIRYFVQTDTYDVAKEILLKNRLLILLGGPGVGKTTISKMLVLYFASIGYGIRYSSNGDIADLKKALSSNREQKEFILLDDCLGQSYFNLKETQETELSSLVKFVHICPDKILLLNSRITIFNEARERSDVFLRMFSDALIRIERIDVEKMQAPEKALIFYALLKKFKVPDEYYNHIRNEKRYRTLVNHHNYNPRIIEYAARNYGDTKPGQYYDFILNRVKNPQNVWKDEFERKLTAVDRYFMYTLYTLTSRYSGIKIEAMKEALQAILPAIKADITLQNFENVLQRLSTSLVRIVAKGLKAVYTPEPYYTYYVQDNSREISFLNPSVRDYVAEMFKDDMLRKFFIENAVFFEQIGVLFDTRQEVADHMKELIASDQLKRLKAMENNFTDGVILYMVVSHQLLDPSYEDIILPGLANFPSHCYFSESFHISHKKGSVVNTLLREPFYSFYTISEKLKHIKNVKCFCKDLDLETLVKILNQLEDILDFSKHLDRSEYLELVYEHVENAAQTYIDSRTSKSEEATEAEYDRLCSNIDEDLYDMLDRLFIGAFDPHDISVYYDSWEAPSAQSGSRGSIDVNPSKQYEIDEVDFILDRDLYNRDHT